MKLLGPGLLFTFIVHWIAQRSMLPRDLYNPFLNHANKWKFQQFSSS